MKFPVLVAVILSTSIELTMAACSSVDMVKLRDAPAGAGQGAVELYTSKETVRRPYEELAVITVDDQGYGLSDETLAEKLKEKAKSIHADGVIITPPERQPYGGTSVGSGAIVGSSVVGSSTWVEGQRKLLRGTAIAYK